MPSTQSVCIVLAIEPLCKNTCCGLRKDGLPCNNVVAIASRRSAHSILEQCQNLPSDSRDFKNNFKTAAKLLLCKRWHQDQQSTIYQEWIGKWEAHEQFSDVDSGYGSDTDEQSLYSNLLSAVLRSGISNETIFSILQTASTASNSTTTANNNRRINRTTIANRNTTAHVNNATNRATAISNQNNAVGRTTSAGRTSITITSSPVSSNTVRTNNSISNTHNHRNQPSPDTTLHTEVRPLPTPPSPPRRTVFRHTYTECPICMDSYEEDSEIWECPTCQNRFHKRCHDLWTNTSPVPSCTFCRARVPNQTRLSVA